MKAGYPFIALSLSLGKGLYWRWMDSQSSTIFCNHCLVKYFHKFIQLWGLFCEMVNELGGYLLNFKIGWIKKASGYWTYFCNIITLSCSTWQSDLSLLSGCPVVQCRSTSLLGSSFGCLSVSSVPPSAHLISYFQSFREFGGRRQRSSTFTLLLNMTSSFVFNFWFNPWLCIGRSSFD